MKIEIAEAVWLHEGEGFSLSELADLSGLPEQELRQLIDYEALQPLEPATDPGAPSARFTASCVVSARTARRLRDDFELDAGGLALTLSLLNRINELEAQLRALHAQFPRRYK
jgi:chaperone modulatory protein CbpM